MRIKGTFANVSPHVFRKFTEMVASALATTIANARSRASTTALPYPGTESGVKIDWCLHSRRCAVPNEEPCHNKSNHPNERENTLDDRDVRPSG
jgi:hypothetical protein